jgi:hypothetical protein
VGALGEEDDNSCAAEVGLVLLTVLDQPHELVIRLNHERLLVIDPADLPAQLRFVRKPHQRATPDSASDLGHALDGVHPGLPKYDGPISAGA